MAKSTVGSGPSFSDAELMDPVPPEVMLKNLPTNEDRPITRFMIGNVHEGGDESSVGNNSSQSSGDGPDSDSKQSQHPQGDALSAENPSNLSGMESDDDVDSMDGSIPETEMEFDDDEFVPWDDPSWSYRDLQLECKERKLNATGTQEELAARLIEHDASGE